MTIENLNASPRGRIVRLAETGQLYYAKDQFFHPMPDEAVVKTNFPNLPIESATISDLSSFEQGPMLTFKDGTLIGIRGFNKIYVIDVGKKRHIASEDVFTGLGYSWDNIVWTDELTGSLHPPAEPIYLRPAPAPTTQVANQNLPLTASPDDIVPGSATTTPPIVSPTTNEFVGDKQFDTAIETYLVADYATGEVLAGKNIDFVHPAASLTKVVAAYQMLLEGLTLSRSVAYDPLIHKVDDRFRIVPGESLLHEHVMYTMLVSSFNTPARMLEKQVEPDEIAFAARMTDSARSLGLTQSTFTEPSGLDTGNRTTAREYLALYTWATKDTDMRRILGLKSYEYLELRDLDGKPRHYDDNSNDLMAKTDLPFTIVTSKTGYLPESGYHLAMHIERASDKKQFIVITMGNRKSADRFREPERFARWAIEQF